MMCPLIFNFTGILQTFKGRFNHPKHLQSGLGATLTTECKCNTPIHIFCNNYIIEKDLFAKRHPNYQPKLQSGDSAEKSAILIVKKTLIHQYLRGIIIALFFILLNKVLLPVLMVGRDQLNDL